MLSLEFELEAAREVEVVLRRMSRGLGVGGLLAAATRMCARCCWIHL